MLVISFFSELYFRVTISYKVKMKNFKEICTVNLCFARDLKMLHILPFTGNYAVM